MKIQKTYAQYTKRNKIDLTLSENPLGCSRLVLKALKRIDTKDISTYPDSMGLTKEIAKFFSVKKENILLGCGSEQLIKLIAQTYISANDTSLVQKFSFPLFSKESQTAGAKLKICDVGKLNKNTKAKLIFICNPNNPTGEELPTKIIKSIIQKNQNSIIVIDEAGIEFTDQLSLTTAIDSSNPIVLKTFSKAFGLAGLRIGFAIGPEKLITKLSAVQQPFPISNIACKLAQAALLDKKFLTKTKKYIKSERIFLIKELTKRGFDIPNSSTNNLFIFTPRARKIIKKLNRFGVSVIDGSSFPGQEQEGFRISIRDKKTNRKFLKVLDKILACTNK